MATTTAEPQPTRRERSDDQSDFRAFDKGIDRNSPRTAIKAGGYEDAVNILLTGASSGKHPTSLLLDSELDSGVTWPPQNPQWCAPFSYSVYDEATQVLSFNTQLLVARARGHYHSYISGSPGTVASVRRVSQTLGTNPNVWQINSFVYDQWLCTVDGRNAPMKYGQHFFDASGHTTPYLFPIGSLPISPLVGAIAGAETWAFSSTGEFETDAQLITDGIGTGARVATHSLRIAPSETVRLTFNAARDFVTGPAPYASRDFVNTDSIQFQYYKVADAGGLTIRFYKTYNTVYRTYTSTTTTTGAWTLDSLVRTGADTGGFVDADLGAITDIEFISSDAANSTYVDDLYFLYSDAPPAAQVGVAHKDRIVLGGAPLIGTSPSLGTLIYSNAEAPDNFATAGINNTQAIGGGAESLAKTNQITALREYQDSVIVGTPGAIFAWTVGPTGTPARSTVSTEHGIDSQRGVIETPNGALLFPWQRGIYILRATGRQFIGAKIQPFLANVATDDMSWTMAVLDEKTKTIRFWFR